MTHELLIDRDGPVAVLTLNRPHAGNSLTIELINELGKALVDCRDDDGVRAVVITGSGERAFCAGTDLRSAPNTTAFDDQFSDPPLHLSRGFQLWKPVIAAVNGYAIGGGFELALSCDLRYASSTATFSLPEAKIGSMPGAGGTQRLVRQAPHALAMELLLTGDRWGVEKAERAGLINDVYAPDELMPRVIEVAKKISRNAPLSIKAIKQAVSRGQHLELSAGLTIERTLFNLLRDTSDREEGRAAFAEKREPRFTGQ